MEQINVDNLTRAIEDLTKSTMVLSAGIAELINVNFMNADAVGANLAAISATLTKLDLKESKKGKIKNKIKSYFKRKEKENGDHNRTDAR